MGLWMKRRAWIGLAVAFAFAPAAAFAQDGLVIFAAASLKNALDEIATGWKASGKPAPRISYAASSALAKQMEQGAPADLFISADLDWMNYLEQRHLIKPDTRRNLLRNRLVLVAPANSKLSVDIAPGFPLAALLGNGRLAMANPDAVPAGKYARASLEALGVWKEVQSKVASAENVRAALVLVSRGEAPLGIVYSTDAVADPKVRVAGTFPDNTHPPIIYPVALTAGGKPAGAAFLGWLNRPEARAIFKKYGF
jgi:molybdate transport system substrate-binding protein